MAIRFRNVFYVAALVAVTTLVTTQVVSQDHGQDPADMDAMMQEWMKLAEPGKEHEHFKRQVGTWRGESSHWMYPGAEPVKSVMFSKMKTIMGGRFMIHEAMGEMDMGFGNTVFEGLGLYGFDNGKKKHFYTWVDSMGTMMMYAEGTAGPDGKTVTYMSDLPDPVSGGTHKIKTVSRMVNDDKGVFSMYMLQPDDTWFMNMEIVSTRVK